MVVFEKVRYKNFLSTGNSFIEINLNSHPVTIITGKNGGGKSTILDAICFGLFNKGFRNVPKGNFINSINGGDLVVEIEFSIGKKKYFVRRGSKPNIFDIHINGKPLDQLANVRDQQDYFEKNILRMNWKAFTQVVMLGSASHTPFMQLPSGNRREIIEELLDLKVFSTMKSLLKDKVDTLKHNLDKVNLEISTIESKIEIEETYIEKSKQSSSDRIDKDKEEIDNTRIIIEEENAIIESLKIELSEYNELELKTSHVNVEKSIRELEIIEGQINTKIKKLEKTINFFLENTTCPECTQSITEEWKENAVSLKEKELETTNSGTKRLTQTLTKFKVDKKDIIDKINLIDSLRKKINAHKNNISSYQKFVERLESSINGCGVIEEHRDSGATILKYNSELVKKKLEKDVLIDKKDIYAISTALLKDSGIKANIIKKYIPIINKSINHYLSLMDFYVKFNLDENFEESIHSRHLDNFKYSNFSQGEKQRIDLAILLTWRVVAQKKNSMATNLLMFDEIFDSALDGEGSDAFAKILKSMTDQNLIIITHRPEMAEKLESDKNCILKFEKHKNFTNLIQE